MCLYSVLLVEWDCFCFKKKKDCILSFVIEQRMKSIQNESWNNMQAVRRRYEAFIPTFQCTPLLDSRSLCTSSQHSPSQHIPFQPQNKVSEVRNSFIEKKNLKRNTMLADFFFIWYCDSFSASVTDWVFLWAAVKLTYSRTIKLTSQSTPTLQYSKNSK